MSAPGYDVVVVGGGLAGELLVLALAKHAPAARVALVERAAEPAGNKTWCCHASDLAPPAAPATAPASWFSPLVSRRWPAHRVRFPRFSRVLDGEYLCLRADELAKATRVALRATGSTWRGGCEVSAVGAEQVELASGEVLTARLVLDARGASAAAFAGRAGYQKFIGWELELPAAAAGDELPTLMDATVAQHDGYRFIYTLPFSPTRMLVEDTTFSRHPDFPLVPARDRLRAYLRESGRSTATMVREEAGVLPMPWAASTAAPSALAIGYRGGFFHPGTGYSLARAALVAERLATVVAAGSPDLPRVAADALAELRASFRASDAFARLLNRVAFGLVPEARLRDAIFARVYRLPEPVLARFYAGRTTRRDRLALATAPLGIPRLRAAPWPNPLLGENP